MLISTLLVTLMAGRPSTCSRISDPQAGPLYFFIFDLLMLSGRDVMAEPLVKRRDLIESAHSSAEAGRSDPLLPGTGSKLEGSDFFRIKAQSQMKGS